MKSSLRHIIYFILVTWLSLLFYEIKGQTPSNNCSTAAGQQLAVGTNCNAIPFDIGSALGAPAMAPCNGFTATGEDGWGWFVATSTMSTVEYIHYDRDAQIHIYSGVCGTLTEIACADVWGTPPFLGWYIESTTFPTTIGQTYFVRINRVAGTSGVMAGDICVHSAPTPANDNCANAVTLTCGANVTGSTLASSSDVIPGGCFSSTPVGGVWYKFVGTGYNVTASLCGSTYDTQIAILTGSCGSFSCAGYNDQFCGDQSQITFPSVLGTTYYIYVFGYVGDTGNFTLNLNCETPPPPPCTDVEPTGCPDIDLGLDLVIPTCTDPCTPVTLNTSFFEVGTTTSYSVCNIPYTPFPYNVGTGFGLVQDDYWTASIPLPFHFCFFGVDYTSCVVGPNGVLSFNPAYSSAYCTYSFSATCPNTTLFRSCVFGAYHDMDPSVSCSTAPCPDARYVVLGTAPCRVFVVSYDNIPHFSCNSLKTSCEIVLYETTNVIEVYIENKPTCLTWNSGNALIGIQNAAGTVGFVPPGRNTGPWSASNEGWRFIPNGPSAVTIDWFEQGNPASIGTGSSFSICPMDPSKTYVATATYARCDGSTVVVSDDVNVQCAQLVLPVIWKTFEAQLSAAQDHTLLRWTTATEVNNDYFTIEQSTDQISWQQIGEVKGSGNTDVDHSYSFLDPHPLEGVSYYRIRQNDFNGNFTYSEVRSINKYIPSNLMVYPNPAKDQLHLSPWRIGNSVKMFEPGGRQIAVSCDQSGTIEVKSIPQGVYYLEVHTTPEAEPKRYSVIIQH
jgi:hypothetical protein